MCGEEVFFVCDFIVKGNVNEDGNICDIVVLVWFGNGVLVLFYFIDSYGMVYEFVIVIIKGIICFDYNLWLLDVEVNGFMWCGYDGLEKWFFEDVSGDVFDY